MRPIDPSSSKQSHLPLDVDLALHATPAITLLLEFFLVERKYSPFDASRVAPFLALAYGTYYSLWVEYTSNINGTCKQNHYPSHILTTNKSPHKN